MVRLNVLTKLWNSSSGSIAIINKAIGHCSSALLNSPTTMHPVLLLVSPFFANKGYNPNLEVHPEHELASAQARDFVVNLRELHQELRQTISKAQKSYQTLADAWHKPTPDFQVESFGFIKVQYFHTT
jgi:hypothetical protein